MSKSQKKKVRQITNGKLNPEEVQHLRRCGLTITYKTKNNKRPLRRFAVWWETTAVEKFLEDIVFLLKNAALLDIINLLASITIIISLITWWTDRKERWENEIFSTWQVVNDASEDQSGVLKIALERLLRNEFSLIGFNLANTNLKLANLQQAKLAFANLQQADLVGANLQQADLVGANLQQADLWSANLQRADLRGAKLQQVNLSFANLERANLESVNLQQAVLVGANLQQASVFARNLTPKQIKSACFWEKAIYHGKWNSEKETWVAVEPSNTKIIEELKKDKSSEPEEPVDCSRWSR